MQGKKKKKTVCFICFQKVSWLPEARGRTEPSCTVHYFSPGCLLGWRELSELRPWAHSWVESLRHISYKRHLPDYRVLRMHVCPWPREDPMGHCEILPLTTEKKILNVHDLLILGCHGPPLDEGHNQRKCARPPSFETGQKVEGN